MTINRSKNAFGYLKAFMWAMPLASLLGTRAGNVCAQDRLGSVNDYLNSNPDLAEADEFPMLGIAVINGGSTSHGGHQFEGAEIVDVVSGSPAAIAGLRGRRQRVQMLMATAVMAFSLFFPPAMLGAMVLSSSGVGESHEFPIFGWNAGSRHHGTRWGTEPSPCFDSDQQGSAQANPYCVTRSN